ncbi:transposable element Tc1 transposase [Trichonephila clavipes]|nr:transposable element Tc1 transposase [Trichonephila clavipes]
MQKERTDRRDPKNPPRCTNARDDRMIVHTTVMDRTALSRVIEQPRSASTRTIRCRLQQSGMSARRPLLNLHLTGNHMRSLRQWCNERWTWTTESNDIVFTDESRFCLQHHDGRI